VRLEERRRRLVEWSARGRGLGPASTPAAMLQMSAAPLVDLLGFDAPAQLEAVESAVVATLIGGGKPVAIVVASWAEPLDPLWRLAVTQAMRRAAIWCLLFDGLRLRIVDASRLYARRYLEFDLDLVIDSPASFAALCRDPGDRLFEHLSGLEVTSAGLEDAFLALTRDDDTNRNSEVAR
jgi:hypothetical protein